MAELTNLTDRLAHLRDRKGSLESLTAAPSGGREPSGAREPKPARKKLPERRFANDYFMVFVYALLVIAVITQFALIAWLDIV